MRKMDDDYEMRKMDKVNKTKIIEVKRERRGL